MPLSRLDNFLKNVRGNILYVDPNNLDATDGIENQGNSASRPFKSLQRALIEASRFSYQVGLNNDRFEKTTIILEPGEYFLDNRPGWIPTGTSAFTLRGGTTSSQFTAFSNSSNFNLEDEDNDLYKLNSIHGGVIVPRGVSIVGRDLRKCKIRPLYVPNPENDNIERSAVFRITGGTYFFQFTILDASTSKFAYKDYTTNRFDPIFSHHKLTCFEYVDGYNDVDIDDDFISYRTNRTDLEIYYEKVGLAYGTASGRQIIPDFPDTGVDIQPKVDEYRIVGPISGKVGVSSVRSGDGQTASTTARINLDSPILGLNVDTIVEISGVSEDVYNGTFTVDTVVDSSAQGTQVFEYSLPTVPGVALPSPTGVNAVLSTDTVTGASPYIFNVSLRSIYGMCGMHADGSKAIGFKSMVVAQFTGISLQVDDNAFVKYNSTSGSYEDTLTVSNLHSNSDAKYKPDYRNYHIKASNNSLMQLVSTFAIGFSDQFVTESGGDFSVTNSNSNFGETALTSRGTRAESFPQDDVGNITHLIPPKSLLPTTETLEFFSIDVAKTVSVGDSTRLYVYDCGDIDNPPPFITSGYRFGAKENDTLNLQISSSGVTTEYSSKICMTDTQELVGTRESGFKKYQVGRSPSGINSITSSTLRTTTPHTFLNGETIRIISDNGRLPDGLDNNRIYYAITAGLGNDYIRVAQTPNDVQTGSRITMNDFGGILRIESRVSDKSPNNTGHPLQYDLNESQWYVNVSAATTENSIYTQIVDQGTSILGEATSRTYVKRQPDDRSSDDRIFRVRYVIPSNSGVASARSPIPGFGIQESSDVTGANNTEVALQFSPTDVSMSNLAQIRNFRFISTATYDSTGDIITYSTELPHQLSVGSTVEVNNVTSTVYPVVGTSFEGYNGVFRVAGITSAKSFYVTGISSDPGLFTNDVSDRTTSLPTFRRRTLKDDYYVYDVQQVRKYVPGTEDGVYDLTILNSSNTPTVAPFNDKYYSYSQPTRDLYPQLDRDNPHSSAEASSCYSKPNILGQVDINDPRNSLTRETINLLADDVGPGIGITNIVTDFNGVGATIFTEYDHGLNRATRIVINNGGTGYGNGGSGQSSFYGAMLVQKSSGSIGIQANVRITVDNDDNGKIIGAELMDGGTSYAVGDEVVPVGVPTSGTFSEATLEINKIYNNVNDTVEITNIIDQSGRVYNGLYRITGVSDPKSIEVASLSINPGISTLGIGSDILNTSSVRNIGKSLGINTITYNNNVGFATVELDNNHSYKRNETIAINGFTNNFYNGLFVVNEVVNLTTVVLNLGVSTISPPISGTARAYPSGLEHNYGEVKVDEVNLGGRGISPYAGITTQISSGISTADTTVTISGLTNYDFKIGDFIQVDNEYMRIRSTVNNITNTTNQVTVFRGIFGTERTSHVSGSVVKRIVLRPIEFRRNSIIRASGHTFEYIGYGPGNYSTAFPDRQSKQLTTQEQVIAQAKKLSTGSINYTGMNDRGDFFIGNKRIESTTGREELFATPVQTYTGSDVFSISASEDVFGLSLSDVDISNVKSGITVTGGESGNFISEFNGPVNFTKKIVVKSTEGIESPSLRLSGNDDISRKITVSNSIPTLAGNPGDIVYNANPVSGGSVGWVYTTNNEWKAFGTIDS